MSGAAKDGAGRDAERTQFAPAPARRGYLEPGTRLSSMFQIDAPIARGGMGEVYRGHNIQTGDTVAIKVIKADFSDNEAAFDLFKREARALNNLYHEAIVRYYVFAIDPALNRPYLAMEFVDGLSLPDALREGPLARDDVLALARRIGGGLHVAHQRQIVHRDVSPDNIIMPGGDVRAAKLIDFGIARGGALGAGTIVGTGVAGKYGYMSPEQASGAEVGPKSDIYSFGLVLAEAARGRPLDMGGSLADVVRKRQSLPDLGDLDPQLRPLIAAMLAPDPADRPASMREVAEWTPGARIGHAAPERLPVAQEWRSPAAAAPSAQAQPSAREATPTPMGVKAPPPTRRAPGRRGAGAWAGLAAALALAAAAGGYALMSGVEPPPPPVGAPPPRLQPPRPDVGAEPAKAEAPAPPSSSAPQTDVAALPQSVEPPAGSSFPPPVDDLTPVPGGRIEEMNAFLRGWRGGECFVARALALNASSAQIEGVAPAPEPLVALNDAFRSKFGFEPEIGAWLIAPAQCAVTQFLSRARLDPAAAPRLELGAANLRAGQHLTGVVEAPAGRDIEVWRISDAGEAQNITALVRTVTRSFNLRVEAGAGAGPKPQIILAFASTQPLAALKLPRPAGAEKALAAVLAESQARGLPLGVTLRVFNVE